MHPVYGAGTCIEVVVEVVVEEFGGNQIMCVLYR
jgi:hypothetical protein